MNDDDAGQAHPEPTALLAEARRLLASGDGDRAFVLLDQANELLAEQGEEGDLRCAVIELLAQVAGGNGLDYMVVECLETLLRMRESEVGEASLELVPLMLDLARSHIRDLDGDQALPLLERAANLIGSRDGVEAAALAPVYDLQVLAIANAPGGEVADEHAAETMARRSLWIRERAHGAEHTETAVSWRHLGIALAHQIDDAEAVECHARSLAILERAHGTDALELVEDLRHLADLARRDSDFASREAHLRRVLAIQERHLGTESPELAETLEALAGLYETQGSGFRAGVAELLVDVPESRWADPKYKTAGGVEEALPLYRRARQLRVGGGGAMADGLQKEADFHRREGRLQEAAKLYEEALPHLKVAYGKDAVFYRGGLTRLAEIQVRQGREAEALAHLREAVDCLENELARPDASTFESLASTGQLAQLYSLLGHCLSKTGRAAEATPALEQALCAWEVEDPELESGSSPPLDALVENLLEQKQPRRAAEVLESFVARHGGERRLLWSVPYDSVGSRVLEHRLRVHVAAGELEAAESLAQEITGDCDRHPHPSGFHRYQSAREARAQVCAARDDYPAAVRLMGQVVRAVRGVCQPDDLVPYLERYAKLLRAKEEREHTQVTRGLWAGIRSYFTTRAAKIDEEIERLRRAR